MKRTVRFAHPPARIHRDSVHALIQACTEERRKQSVANVLEAKRRKLSAIPEGVTVTDYHHSPIHDGVSEPLLPPQLSTLPQKEAQYERRTSVQVFIDKVDLISHGVAQLEMKIAALERIYQSAPVDDDDAYVEYVLSKRHEHHGIVQEIEELCKVTRYQIQSIKLDIQSAGKRGILSMDPAVRRRQYNTFIESLSRMMASYLDSELHFVQWQRTLEKSQTSRRTSVISIHGSNARQADNLEQMESEITGLKNLGISLHELRRMFEDLACLVEGQADLLDRIDELEQATADHPIAPVLTADDLEDRMLAEERLQRRMDIKSLVLFGVVGFLIFVILMFIVLSGGQVCDGSVKVGLDMIDNASSSSESSYRYKCVVFDKDSNRTAFLLSAASH
ncbi:hypothetical protein BV898_09842 [Hypsibius exemplaris]|uniref:t-SNARE coiled-coil homology domain-containing protein n=1 Tax=Hypsibius exemplaris TaxID=2072580 RepID=A0A1W0WLL3_HYPEX|nr:hypothetical protein BV898_09842 [Hypsibius exemplaris]